MAIVGYVMWMWTGDMAYTYRRRVASHDATFGDTELNTRLFPCTSPLYPLFSIHPYINKKQWPPLPSTWVHILHPGRTAHASQVVRWSALIAGITYGIFHQSTLQAKYDEDKASIHGFRGERDANRGELPSL